MANDVYIVLCLFSLSFIAIGAIAIIFNYYATIVWKKHYMSYIHVIGNLSALGLFLFPSEITKKYFWIPIVIDPANWEFVVFGISLAIKYIIKLTSPGIK